MLCGQARADEDATRSRRRPEAKRGLAGARRSTGKTQPAAAPAFQDHPRGARRTTQSQPNVYGRFHERARRRLERQLHFRLGQRRSREGCGGAQRRYKHAQRSHGFAEGPPPVRCQVAALSVCALAWHPAGDTYRKAERFGCVHP